MRNPVLKLALSYGVSPSLADQDHCIETFRSLLVPELSPALGDSQVRVSYTYETDTGRRCQGRADVETVYLYGGTLISRIKALDGC